MKKSKASSSRAQAGAFGAAAFGGSSTFGASFGAAPASQLSYVYEPPELINIFDPAIVVCFKTLQKKDSTTKAKALDDLLAYVAKAEEEKQTLEESFLEAWVKLYARVSIDNTRQVRQRAHALQGRLAVVFGKRIARCLPSLVGPWLCGLHDNDKLVVKSTQESLSAAFPTEEKRLGLWKVYHAAILEYCNNAILHEDTKTLSDERTTDKDDADTKFTRTIGSAILTVSRSLEVLDRETLRKHHDLYKHLLDSERLWALAEHSDSFLRQAVYKITTNRLNSLEDSIDDTSLRRLSKALLDKGLRKEQSGSIIHFVALLAKLTEIYPSIWTSHFTSQKKTAPELLRGFLQRLPPMPAGDFWTSLNELLENIPDDIVFPFATPGRATAAEGPVLAAFHDGLARKENYRAASAQAWEVLMALVERFFTVRDGSGVRNEVAVEFLSPLVRYYIVPDEDNIAWAVTGTQETQERVARKAISIIVESSPKTATELLTAISAAVIERMQASLPEQSQGFRKSQQNTGELFLRWNQLKFQFTQGHDDASVIHTVDAATASEIRAAIHLLKIRNGKPFGAALALKYSLDRSVFADTSLKIELETFLTKDAPGFYGTPSSSEIIGLFQLVDKLDPEAHLYNKSLSEVLQRPASPARTSTIQFFLQSTWPSEDSLSKELSKILETDIEEFAKGDTSRAPELGAALGNKTTPQELIDTILARLTNSLSLAETASASLESLLAATSQNQEAVRQYLTTSSGSELGPKLLVLSRTSEDARVQHLAADLSSRTRMLTSNDADDSNVTKALLESLQDGLQNTTSASMSIDILLGLATQVFEEARDTKSVVLQLLVSDVTWKRAITPFLAADLDPSLSILNVLGGAVAWLDRKVDATEIISVTASYDASGNSIPLRMLSYTLQLVQQKKFEEYIDSDDIQQTLIQISRLNELLSDHISVPAKLPLSEALLASANVSTVDLLAQSQGFVQSCLAKSPELRSSVLKELLGASDGSSTAAYYSARAYVSIANETLEIDASTIQYPEDELLSVVRKPSGSIREAARFATAQQGSGKSRVANNLIAELARFNFEAQATTGLRLLTLLNCLMRSPVFDDSAFNQQHRLVIFVKHLITSMQMVSETQILDSEALKALLLISPMIKEIFDNFWTDLVEKLISSFQLPSAGSTLLEPALRLLGALQTLTKDEETNDDLKESWEEKRSDITQALIQLLKRQSGFSSTHNQPQAIVNSILARRLDSFGISAAEASSLYPVIASGSSELQKAAFKILHKTVPAGQEKVAMEAALTTDFVAKLPEELLALVLDAPSEVHDLSEEASLPSHLAQYLYAWELIFDHWNGASYQVQNDYVIAIKEAKHIQGLLDLVFEVAINSRAKPINACQLSFADFNPDLEEGPHRDCHIMICHLYYLALKHVPALVRSWWRDDCPRSLQKAVEDWTEQYFSPLVVAAELDEVSNWAPRQETDTPLEVKVSPRGRQVTAGYILDDQISAISITLPSNYPLGIIAVESTNRVGVDEKRWRTWLIYAQGVMNFAPSSGGIGAVTDGLLGFRRNITGTLKGHTECAICYSIVNADRQLPTKKCGTCKNAFHGTCLFKWFRSSGGSSCPLCRTAFNYG